MPKTITIIDGLSPKGESEFARFYEQQTGEEVTEPWARAFVRPQIGNLTLEPATNVVTGFIEVPGELTKDGEKALFSLSFEQLRTHEETID